MRARLFYMGVLVLLGAGWGITQPLSKIAVSEGYQHFGLIFWQMVIGALLLALINLVRGKGLPMSPAHLRLYVILALIGTIFPNSASYQAAVHLPSGVLSILLSMVPMIGFPIAMALGLDRMEGRRVLGLLAGLVGVLILVVPEASLPDRSMVPWVFVGLISALFYGIEGNFVAKWGILDLDPVQVLFGASLIGAVVSLPLALASGQFIDPRGPYGAPDIALVLSSIIHALVYATYVWLIGRAGTVFAMQVSYLVTGFGVMWARVLLSEAYSPYIWASLGLMFLGMYLVQPRAKVPLAPADPISDTAT